MLLFPFRNLDEQQAYGCPNKFSKTNDKGYKAPSEAHVTQVVKTNGAGEFSFVMPVAGWWGFAALSGGEAAKGSEQPVNELGAVLWIKADELKK